MHISEFDFELPPDRIAQYPAERRDHARLMVVDRRAGTMTHHRFHELPDLLTSGDLLVRNTSKVVPARLLGRREATGGRWEGLFVRAEVDASGLVWELLAQTRGYPRPGEWIVINRRSDLELPTGSTDHEHEGLRLQLVGRGPGGTWKARPHLPDGPATDPDSVWTLLERFGEVPLPPYIRHGREGAGDRDRYQTTYAQTPGSVAAPTAGLHFTPELFETLERRGVGVADLTLHVGIGTFRPLNVETIEAHHMHAETAHLPLATARRLNECRARGGRIVAVGTTSARTLEHVAHQVVTKTGTVGFEAFEGDVDLYIKPGHKFLGLDALITNFHLPRSSLIVLVSALAGVELIRDAYRVAIAEGYRFYSYGDAMLIR